MKTKNKKNFHKAGYVSLIGRPNSGKSTLLNKLIGKKVSITSDKPQTTRINILGIKNTEKGQIIFIDTPGIHKPLHKLNKRMMSFVYSTLTSTNLICLLVDSTQSFGKGDLFVIENLKKVSNPIFLLINKVDIVKKDKILLMIDRYKDLLDFKEIIPISALEGIQLPLLEEKIYEYLPDSEKLFGDENDLTPSQKFLLSELIREKILEYVREELPYSTAVYIQSIENHNVNSKENEISKKAVKYIKASIFVEKDNQRKIIIGKRGQLIKSIGMKARKEIEAILGFKVYLDLSVRVKEKWRDSPDILDLIEQQ